jgi:hypothetical protein
MDAAIKILANKKCSLDEVKPEWVGENEEEEDVEYDESQEAFIFEF